MARPLACTAAPTGLLAGALAFAAATLLAPPVAAQSETGAAACGNIDVRAEARCEVLVEGGCIARCEPASFEAVCEVDCRGQCTASPSVDCVADCSGACEGECTVDPGNFDCSGHCTAECEGSCEGSCEAGDDGAECRAACAGRCEGSCEADCTGTPPEAACDARCEASCEGSCSVQANARCEGSCVGGCKADLQGGCEAQCTQPEGALFCDGQYVDTGNNLEECIAYLQGVLNVTVTSRGSAACVGNACEAEGEVSCSCAVPGRTSRTDPAVLLGLSVAALLAARRRRVRTTEA